MTQFATDNTISNNNKGKSAPRFVKNIYLHKMQGNQKEQLSYFLDLQKHVLEEFLTKAIPTYIEYSLTGHRLITSSASVQIKPGIPCADELQVSVSVSKMGDTSIGISFFYRNQHDKATVATGAQTILFVCLEGKAEAIPKDVVAALFPYLDTDIKALPSETGSPEIKTKEKNTTPPKRPSRTMLVKKSDLIPRKKTANYAKEFITTRRQWVAEKTGSLLHHAGEYSINPDELKSRIENMIGVAQIPLGIAGPLKVNGEHANGFFYVPLATTEGTLVETYQRGMLAVTMAGGANVRVVKESLSFSPIFILKSITDVPKFMAWIKEHFAVIKSVAESTTSHGKLIEIVPYIMGRRVILDFRYTTGDAMGMNMVSIATGKACNYIMEQTDVEHYYLTSNLSSEKKASFFNLITGYGKEVSVEVTFPRDVMLKYLGTTPEGFYDFWFGVFLGGSQAGMVGMNGHFANALAATFIACGQDAAQVVNACIGMTICELTTDGSLSMSLKLPNMIVGTVGGGTMTGTAKECLEILGCAGPDRARKFAEIIGATLLAGDIAIGSAMTNGNFHKAHIRKRGVSTFPAVRQDYDGVRN